MAARQLGRQLVAERVVDRLPETFSPLDRLVNVRLGEMSSWLPLSKLGLDFLREAIPESVQAVDRPRHAVEPDALETNFAHELGGIDWVVDIGQIARLG